MDGFTQNDPHWRRRPEMTFQIGQTSIPIPQPYYPELLFLILSMKSQLLTNEGTVCSAERAVPACGGALMLMPRRPLHHETRRISWGDPVSIHEGCVCVCVCVQVPVGTLGLSM